MALQPFTWGSGGQKASPSSIKRQAEIAAALAARSGAPSNVGEGLSRVGEALLHNSMVGRAEAGEAEGAASRQAVMEALLGNSDPTMADIGGALGNEWVTSDPGSSAIVQALLGQELQQNDPLRQQQLQMGEIELNNARNPPPPAPDYGFTFAPDGTLIRTDDTTGTFDPMGQFAKPESGPLVQNIIQPNAGDDSFFSGLNAADGGVYAGFLEAAPTAARNISRLDQLGGLLEGINTGGGAGIQQALGELGINTEGLSEIQAAQALINSMVPEQRQPGSGPMSDADLALFKQSIPRIINQTGGNQLIVDTIRAINEYDLALAQITQDGMALADQATTPEQRAAIRTDMRAKINALQNPMVGFEERMGKESPQAGGIDPKYTDDTPPEGWGGGDVGPELWQFMTPEDRALW